MKNRIKMLNIPVFLCFMVFSLLTACVNQDFDTPPADPGTSNLQPNTTVAELKTRHVGGEFEEITEDLIIEAVVVADDESGNFYRQLIVQDATGGIELRINVNELYTDYPIGRKIFVKCQGLWLGDYNGLIQMGAGTYVDNSGNTRLAGLEAGGVADHIEKGPKGQEIIPPVVQITELTTDIQDPYINTLIQLEEVEFVSPGETFATYDINTGNRFSENRAVRDCNGNEIDLRSSGYADFVNELTPDGKGTMTVIYSIFGTSTQMYIRNTDDINFSGPRCDGSVGGGNAEPIDISDVRALFPGSDTAPSGKKIVGTVISDRTNGNINSRNLFIQDDSGAGIVVRFEDDHNFNLNEQIEVEISGVEISEYNGLLQLNNVPNNNAASLGQGTVTPNTLTIGELIPQTEALESTLVRFENVLLTKSGGSDFEGGITLNDGTGTLTLWTFGSATFAGNAFPTNTVNLTGIVSQFNDVQITLRNLDDIEGGNGGGGGGGNDGDVDEDFEGTSPEQDINLNGWSNIAVTGERRWQAKEFSGNSYAQATAFNDNNPEMEAWLITPEIDLDEDKVLTFESAKAYYTHDGMSVWISSDFDGTNVTSASWTQLNCTIAGQSDADHAWIPSGEIDLSSFSGKARIGFKYSGNNTDGTTSYRIDNILVEAK